MKEELRSGKLKYISFIILDIACLYLANYLSAKFYLEKLDTRYNYNRYQSVIAIMVVIDILVTIFLNTLQRVMRRKKRYELLAGLKHIGSSFVILAVVLFSTRTGSDYSRVTVYLSYTVYYLFFFGTHTLWKVILNRIMSRKTRKTAILMTTDGFVDEGLSELKKLDIDVRYIYLLKNLKRDSINGIPVVKSWEQAASVICWEHISKVYIYGLDHQMVPEYLKNACQEMNVEISLVDFNYRVINIKTIANEDPKYGSLTFLEGKRDLPFPIRRAYWITETEAELHRGFHAHKLNCQLLFCPYGEIDIIMDDGENKTTVTLDEPGKGLILMPGLWREMVWRKSRSVLCVLASEYYDPKEYIRDYDEFLVYSNDYREKHTEEA